MGSNGYSKQNVSHYAALSFVYGLWQIIILTPAQGGSLCEKFFKQSEELNKIQAHEYTFGIKHDGCAQTR